jgi:hypothetical protein
VLVLVLAVLTVGTFVAALAGSTIGGLTSLTASWLTQHVQFRTQLPQ